MSESCIDDRIKSFSEKNVFVFRYALYNDSFSLYFLIVSVFRAFILFNSDFFLDTSSVNFDFLSDSIVKDTQVIPADISIIHNMVSNVLLVITCIIVFAVFTLIKSIRSDQPKR